MDFENFDRSDCTILTKAVKTGKLEYVQVVLTGLKETTTSSLHTTDRQGYTALHHAVLLGHPLILQALVEHADERCINTESHDRTTALLLACTSDHPLDVRTSILETLLVAKASPNLPATDPFALPLQSVLERKWWAAARMLVEAGASVVATDFEHDDIPPMYLATDDLSTVQLMVSKGSLPAKWRRYPLLYWLLLDSDEGGAYSRQHVHDLYRIIAQHGRCISTLTILIAAKHRHLHVLHDMLQRREVQGIFNLFDPICQQVTNWLLLEPLCDADRLVRQLVRLMLLLREEDDWRSCLVTLVAMCNAALAEVLIDECNKGGYPVARWRSDESCLHGHFCSPCCTILPRIFEATTSSARVGLLNTLVEAGVPVTTDSFLKLAHNLRLSFEAPERSDLQCLGILLQCYVGRQSRSLRHPDILEACRILRLCAGALYLLLREGVAAEDVIETEDTWTDEPFRAGDGRSLLECVRQSCAVVSRFLQRTTIPPMLYSLPHSEPGYQAAMEQIKNEYLSKPAPVRSLQHLARLNVRKALGCSNLRAKVASLYGHITTPAVQYLMFEDEFDMNTHQWKTSVT